MLNIDPLACIEAEQALLACALADRQAYCEARSVLKNKHFYLPLHEEIFRALALYHSPQDPPALKETAYDHLVACGLPDDSFVKAYILDLVDLVNSEVSLQHTIYYACIVRDHYKWHQLLRASNSLGTDE